MIFKKGESMENNTLVKTSIFKQEQHRVIYDFLNYILDGEYSGRKYYYGLITSKTEKISEQEIFTCSLEMPLLSEGEEFYIEELSKTVKIKKRVRSSKESVYYYVEPEYIEDEESLNTKNRCRKLQDSFNMYEQKVKDLENFKKQVEKSFWYNFINIK